MANQALKSAGEKALDKLTEKLGGKDSSNAEGEKKNVVGQSAKHIQEKEITG